MNVILFDENRINLYPYTLTRPIAEIRWGILKISDKWGAVSDTVSWLTEDYLSEKYLDNYTSGSIYINGRMVPTQELVDKLKKMETGESIHTEDGRLIALKAEEKCSLDSLNYNRTTTYTGELISLENVWDIFLGNEREIRNDFLLLTKGKKSATLSQSNTIIGDNVFLEEGAKVEGAILNSNTGPIYIGKNAEVMEGSVIRGPFALCEAATVKMSAKIYGGTTVGPHSKVGGEINNSVIFGYSNKGHDGFLGNSVLGEWCNLGADTNVSNLKNDYGMVKIWDAESGELKNTQQQFCGLMMGDHSKSGINTMFNTGTVVGVSANIFGAGFPDKHIPSFSWGGGNNWTVYRFEKAIEVAKVVMQRRNIVLDAKEESILRKIFENSKAFSNF